MARELIVLPRFKHDYRLACRHPEFDKETLEHVFELLLAGEPLPEAFKEHRLGKRGTNWAGFYECHLGAALLLIYRISAKAVALHRIGWHAALFRRAR